MRGSMSKLSGPRQIALVTSRHKGKDNIITIAWHMPTSFSPNLYAISIDKSRFSHGMISGSGVFCVNFISEAHRDRAELCGNETGRDKDKFRDSGFGKAECTKIDCPRIADALGFLECRVVRKLGTGDHTIFIGEVLNSWLKGPGKRLYHITGSTFTTTID